MKRITSRIAITLLTFLIGMAAAAFWTVRYQTSSQSVKKEADCIPAYVPDTYSSREKDWGTVLARFHEMHLDSLPHCVDESYRVIWLPTFHSPVAIRVWSSQGARYLVTKQLDGKGGYMGNLALDKTRPLTEEEWFNFTRRLADSSFWDMPSIDSGPIPHDGATWVIEGIQHQRYHNVHRRTPSKEFRQACAYLIELSGLKTEVESY